MGRWHVVSTTFPFWRRRRNPTITYGPLPGEPVRFSDRVAFRQPRRLGAGFTDKTIDGIDTRLDRSAARFRWRGTGALCWISGVWSVVAIDPDYRWAVTWFDRTTVGTPPGWDVYTRDPDPDPDLVALAVARVPGAAGLPWFEPGAPSTA